jgi:hypothetical protein
VSERDPRAPDPRGDVRQDDVPQPPPTTADPYRPHMRDRQPWASRGRILVWAWIPVVVIAGLVVWAQYG